MTADLLSRAAAKIRETAQGAMAGPWSRHDFGHPGEQEPSSIVVHTGKFDWDDLNGGESETAVAWMAGWDSQEDANAEHIALWSPDVAELVARVLDESAGWCEMYDDPGEAERVLHAEFALARRILGED